MDNFKKPTDDELKQTLSPIQYQVTQHEGTERPFQNAYWDNHEAGIYVDVVSGEPLFSSLDKFDSGTGWPSFTKPLVPENVTTKTDRSLLMTRTEVRSAHADSHLGHLFDDGPKPTGQRYCMNSASMRFIPVAKLAEEGYGEYLRLFDDVQVNIGIVGGGGIGSYYAGILSRAGHSVRLVTRGEHLSAIKANGLAVKTPDEQFTATFEATDDGACLVGCDYVIVAVKGYSLAEVGPMLAGAANSGASIVPLLNGVDAAERLEALGVPRASIIGGLATVSLFRTAPGVVERKSPFDRVVLGELDRAPRTHHSPGRRIRRRRNDRAGERRHAARSLAEVRVHRADHSRCAACRGSRRGSAHQRALSRADRRSAARDRCGEPGGRRGAARRR